MTSAKGSPRYRIRQHKPTYVEYFDVEVRRWWGWSRVKTCFALVDAVEHIQALVAEAQNQPTFTYFDSNGEPLW